MSVAEELLNQYKRRTGKVIDGYVIELITDSQGVAFLNHAEMPNAIVVATCAGSAGNKPSADIGYTIALVPVFEGTAQSVVIRDEHGPVANQFVRLNVVMVSNAD